MRTLLLVTMLLAVVSVCHGEDVKKTEYAVSVDTTKINLGQQVDDVAEALKKHLDGPLGMYYQAAVRKNLLIGWFSVVVGCVFCISGPLVMFLCDSDDGGHIAAGIALLVVGLGITIAGIPHALCPEYYAFNDILSKIGTIVH